MNNTTLSTAKSEVPAAGRPTRSASPRDRATDWDPSAAVPSARWTRAGAAQAEAPSRFLRLLNCRATLALAMILTILTLAGGLRAQQQGAKPNYPGLGDTTQSEAPPTNFNATNSLTLYPLKYADAIGMAAMINDLFAPARPPLPGFNGTSNGFARRTNEMVFARADARTQTVVVIGPDAATSIIRDLVQKLDQPTEDIMEVQDFHLKNADATDMAKLLSNLFPAPSDTNDTANLIRFGTTTPSNFEKKEGLVTAVPDPRTQSLIVSASKDMMPQIEDMINQLDSMPPKPAREAVGSRGGGGSIGNPK